MMEKRHNAPKFVGTKSRSAGKCVSNLISKVTKCRAAVKVHEKDKQTYIKKEQESSNSKTERSTEEFSGDTLSSREVVSNSESRINYAAYKVNFAGLESETSKCEAQKKESKNANKELTGGDGNRSYLANSTRVMDCNEMIENFPDKRNNILHSSGVLK